LSSNEINENQDTEFDLDIDESMEIETKLFPIKIMGVLSIPRDAMVEVEIISNKRNHFIDDMFRTKLWVVDSILEDDNLQTPANDLIDEINSWPLWKFCDSMIVGSQTSDNYSSQPKFEDNIRMFNHEIKSEITMQSMNRCVTAGFAQISGAHNTPVLAVRLLWTSITKILRCSELSVNNLLNVRIYYQYNSFGPREDFVDLVKREKFSVMGLDFPVSLVPVAALEIGCFLVSQFLAIDVSQLETEIWIKSK
jgi:hypothetical protein